jgi:cobalt/nickel transport system permease protein
LQPDNLSRWSTQSSIIHHLDPRVKLITLLSFVFSLALLRYPSSRQLAAALAALLTVSFIARLPWSKLLLRTLFVVPVIGLFSLILFLSGDHLRAWAILSKSYLCIFAVLLTVSTTTLPSLLEAARWCRVPSMLIDITQLIYRYLFVLASQAQQMLTAFRVRGGSVGKRAFLASAGMVAVLFGRSYQQAEFTHQAMLSRGFDGSLPTMTHRRFASRDLIALVVGIAATVVLHYLRS